MEDKDVYKALELFENHDTEVDQAIREYNPQTHAVMKRLNKYRKGEPPYITEKLPRTRQRYINEVELFFLLGNPIVWKKVEGSDETYRMFTDFLHDQHFDSCIRKAKRLAGAETESALVIHVYRDDDSGERVVKLNVLARSTGYKLRPLFDQYGNMTAFAYGYTIRQGARSVQHWNFQTPKFLFFCEQGRMGWQVDIFENPTGKINVIYIKQPKAWDGAEPRINREEMLDSKTGDTNNYFSDPMAAATADVVNNLTAPDKPGRLIQLTGANSRFEYINPPQSSQTRESEKNDLKESILFDTFTPDFDVQAMKGFGSLSGVAIKNAFVLGYMKRDNRKEIYGELVGRFRNIVIGVLKSMHPDKAAEFDKLKIDFEFSEPFASDNQSKWQSIVSLYQAGLVSLESAVTMLSLTDAPEVELNRIKAEAEAKAQAAHNAEQQTPSAKGAENEDGEATG